MKGLWGLGVTRFYSEKAKVVFDGMVQETKQEFSREYSNAFDNEREFELTKGTRYYDNEKLFYALQSKVAENDFLNEPKHYLFRILLGACASDYYYTYEKEW